MAGMLLRQLRRPAALAAASCKSSRLLTSQWRSASSKSTVAAAGATPAKPKKKYLNDPSLRVRIVPMLEDNYGYVVVDETNHTMFAVDPAEPSKILPAHL